MNRVWRVLRIQLVNAPMVLAFPLGILALTLAINIGIFAAIGDSAAPDERTTGALVSIYIVLLVAHLQTITQVFPFALGLSVTRRAFFAATALLVTGQALGYGILLYLLKLAEGATNGWGVQMRFFRLSFLVEDNALLQILNYTVPFLFFSFIGVFVGVVFRRWSQPGVYVMMVSTGLVVAVAVVVATWQRWWPAIGRFFTDQSSLALLAGYPIVLAALFAGGGYLLLRRATA